MRVSSSVTSISWIPSEAIKGAMKMPFQMGLAHYDEPPPDVLEDLEVLRAADRFRFANVLAAWIDLAADGTISAWGYEGGGSIGATTLRVGTRAMTFAAVEYDTLRPEPEMGDGWVRFAQTCGGRTGVPAPRPVPHPPFFRIAAPTAWTTLSLTLHADGRCEYEVAGASPFPRHWIYDDAGKLAAKTGLIDFKDWAKHAFGARTPWGEEDSPALVTQVETALERALSQTIMRGSEKPDKRKIKKGAALTEQGSAGDEIFLLLDGVLAVEVDGAVLAEVGPGAILGERATLERGTRTSTLRALTKCTVVAARADQIDREALGELARGHRREEQASD